MASSKKSKREKKGKKGKKGKKKRKGAGSSAEEEGVERVHHRPMVNVSHGELPDGAMVSEGEGPEPDELDEVSKALNQNLDM